MDYRIFNVRAEVNACDCTRGCTDTRKRVCTESWLWEKNPLPHWGIEPASAAWRSDALTNWATELCCVYGILCCVCLFPRSFTSHLTSALCTVHLQNRYLSKQYFSWANCETRRKNIFQGKLQLFSTWWPKNIFFLEVVYALRIILRFRFDLNTFAK